MPLHDVSSGYRTGDVLDYVERTSNLTASTEADWITGNSILLSGNMAILLQAFCAYADVPQAGGIILRFYDGASALNRDADFRLSSTGVGLQTTPIFPLLRITPSAGFHTFKVTAALAGTGTAVLNAGAASGGASTYAPAWLKVSVA